MWSVNKPTTSTMVASSEMPGIEAADADAKIRSCDKAISELLTCRGRLQFLNGNTEQSIADFTQAAEFDQQNALAFYCRSLAEKGQRPDKSVVLDLDRAGQLDSLVAAKHAAPARLESGYRVVATYPLNGAEHAYDHRYLGVYPPTLSGFRQATDSAKQLSRNESRRSELADTDQVKDRRFIPVVEEYHATIREVLRVPPPDYVQFLPKGVFSQHDVTSAPSVPYCGYWSFWEYVLDHPKASNHQFTEQDAIAFNRAIEASVNQSLLQDLTGLAAALGRFTDRQKALEATYELCQQHNTGSFTAEELARCFDLKSGTTYAEVTAFVSDFQRIQQTVMDSAIETDQDQVARLPKEVMARFTDDLRRIVAEELLDRLAGDINKT